MDELEKLKVMIEAELGPYKKSMQEIKKETSSMATEVNRQTNSVKNSFAGIFSFIKKAMVGIAIAKIGKEALSLASDAEETEAVVELAFGNMRHYVDEFAKSSIEKFGMSSVEAKQTAGDFMLMSKGMGLVGDDAAKMAVHVAGFTSDLASLKNTSQEVAKTALTGIWTGETEALKKYGIVMTQANLSQFAMSQGLSGNIQKMTQQEQVMLRYAYVMDVMGMAQGNFARESVGWAAQVKILSSHWKELLTIIGKGLMVVLLPVLKFINTIMAYLIRLAQVVSAVFSKLFNIGKKSNTAASSIGKIGSSVGGLSNNIGGLGNAGKKAGKGSKGLDKLGKSAEKAGKKAKGALASFDTLNVLTSTEPANTKAPSLGKAGGFGGIDGMGVGGISIPEPNFGEWDGPEISTDGVENFVSKVQNLLEKANDFWKKHKELIISLAIGRLIGGIAGAYGAAFAYLWQTSENFRDSVIDTFNKIKKLVTDVISGICEEFKKFWEYYGQPIIQGLSDAWMNWVGVVEAAWYNIFKPIIDARIEAISILWENVLQPTLGLILTIIGEVITISLDLWNKVLAPFLQWLANVFGPIVQVVTKIFIESWKFASSAIGAIIKIINISIQTIGTVFRGVVDIFSKLVHGDFKGAWEAIKNMASAVWNNIKEVWSVVKTWFTQNVIDPIKNIFTNLWESVKSLSSQAWQGIKNTFYSAKNWFRSNVTDPIKNVFFNAWDSIKSKITSVWDSVLRMFNSGGEIFKGVVEGISGIFKRIVNRMLRGINSVIAMPFRAINGFLNKIKSISILGLKPFNGFWSYNPISIPQIPQLAVGTNYVQREGLAMIHEGEAVVPKKYNPAAGGNLDQIELLKEQNSLLRKLLEKDNSVYLDGDKLHQNNEKRKRQEFERYGYAY